MPRTRFRAGVAGEERGARGVAERELAVVAVEANAAGGEGVDVGAVRVEAGVVAGEFGAHVVGHEEEDVERAFALFGGGGACCAAGGRVAAVCAPRLSAKDATGLSLFRETAPRWFAI